MTLFVACPRPIGLLSCSPSKGKQSCVHMVRDFTEAAPSRHRLSRFDILMHIIITTPLRQRP